jgi:2-amino-4-hydroxy-6-hydroxymethyldihydropteridine diphosphokinase
MNIVFLGIGTNLGNRELNLELARARIEEFVGKVQSSSSVYETEPWGFQSEDKFLNIVVSVETNLSPSGLLGRVLMIESLLGRVRGPVHYSSRLIDIDILFYDSIVIDEESLKVPHPHIPNRKFVLIPLCEIAPDLKHPVLGKTMKELLETCPDECVVTKFG